MLFLYNLQSNLVLTNVFLTNVVLTNIVLAYVVLAKVAPTNKEQDESFTYLRYK